ncbi:MAG: hypothetical protein R3D59_17340 [Paracoccaceae bacterium]
MIIGKAKPTTPFTNPANSVIPATANSRSTGISANIPSISSRLRSSPRPVHNGFAQEEGYAFRQVTFVYSCQSRRIFIALQLQNTYPGRDH